MTPEAFTIIKNKIEQSTVLSRSEKREWLFLLPKMSESQMKEPDRILSIRMSAAAKNPIVSPPVPPPLPDLAGIKNLSLSELRASPSVYDFLEKLGATIRRLRAAGTASARDIETAFDASPLQKSYIESGLKLMSGDKQTSLSKDEFEMITDFRSTFRKLLSA